MQLLHDLAFAARRSGLRVIELEDWRRNLSAGDFEPRGVACHHTGAFDALTDAANDLDYARWLAFVGRPDLPPPLCHLALSAEGIVYVCSAGNANHAGSARASGPMPAGDGNVFYVGIEAMNSGSQGWRSIGTDAAGNEVTQYDAYARLCAALCQHYGWPVSHVRAHWEISLTGKWDPGDPLGGSGPDGRSMDMDAFRARVQHYMQEDDMSPDEVRQIIREELVAFGKNAGDLIKIDHDEDPNTAKWSLERVLRWLK